MTTAVEGVETLHPRSTWMSASHPVNGPLQVPRSIRQPVAHYTAADDLIDGDPGEYAENLPAYLRAIQRDYVVNRGYSIGYLWAVDWLGGAWELRGFDFKSAANAGHNEYTAPILFLVDGADPATPLMWRTARALGREYRRRANRSDFADRFKGHGQLYAETSIGTPTACPGVGIQSQLDTYSLLDLGAGTGDPNMDMTPLVVPKRAYDSRPQYQGATDPALAAANSAVPKTPLTAGNTRGIVVGMTNAVFVRVTMISANPGFITISGDPNIRSNVPAVNGDPDGVEGGAVPLAVPHGTVYVTASTACDFTLDLFAD